MGKSHYQMDTREYDSYKEAIGNIIEKINYLKQFSGLYENLLQICWDLIYLGNVDIPYRILLQICENSIYISESQFDNWIYLRSHFALIFKLTGMNKLEQEAGKIGVFGEITA